jgi:2-haloacid dehalogenase
VTFDCYGTLVDWRAGISACIERLAPGRSAELLPLYYEAEAEVQAGEFRPYREVLQESLRRAASRAGVDLPAGAERLLPESLPSWPVFPDVAAGLGALRAAGRRLGVLSNVDADLFAATRQRLPVPMEAVVTADEVRSYKPAAGHFESFMAARGLEPGDWVHAAQSLYHDVVPAARLGIPCVWIDRLGEARGGEPAAAVLPGLLGLEEAVARLANVKPGA